VKLNGLLSKRLSYHKNRKNSALQAGLRQASCTAMSSDAADALRIAYFSDLI